GVAPYHANVIYRSTNGESPNVASGKEERLHSVGVRLQNHSLNDSRVVKCIKRNIYLCAAKMLQNILLDQRLHHRTASAVSHRHEIRSCHGRNLPKVLSYPALIDLRDECAIYLLKQIVRISGPS